MTSSKRYLAFVGITVFVAGFSAGIFWQPD